MNIATIDPALPALGYLFDLPAMTQGFAACPPAGAGVADREVRACTTPSGWQVMRLQHLHYQPGQRCTATYALCQTRPGLPPLTTMGVVECTPYGLAYRCFQLDPALPWLATAADAAGMAHRLTRLAPPTSRQETATRCEITPIRYRPGARCALSYRLGGPTGTHHFFGKLFRQPDPQRMAALPLLYAHAQADAALPRVPRLLAYWPDLHLLILPVVNGAELHEVIFDATVPLAVRVDWFAQLGAKLAALHNLAPLDLPHRTLAADLADLATYLPIIDRLLPALATAYAAALQALTVIAPTLPAVAPVVCHGALRTDQFLLTKPEQQSDAAEELMLIDLDTLCLAHPATDIGNCLAYLQWKAMRQPQHATLIVQAEQALLTGYAAVRGLPPAASIALYRAVALLKIAGRRFPNLTYREWPLTPQLVQAAHDLIATTPLNAGSVSAL